MNKTTNKLSTFVRLTYKYGLIKSLGLILWHKIKIKDFEIEIRKGTSDLIVFQQVFLLPNYNLASIVDRLFKEKKLTIVDLGANVGFFSIKSLLDFNINKIYSFEPEFSNINQFEKNTKFVPKESLEIIKCAISDLKGYANFTMETGSEWSARIDEDSSKNNYKVETVVYSDYLEEKKLDYIDILKIDIEGAERFLFSDKEKCQFIKNTGIVIIELHESYSPGCSRDFFSAINHWLPKWRMYIRGENIVIVNLSYNF
jgi:FkbM family methyltransferase